MVWDNAVLALSLAAIDPERLGGVNLRARAGPVRDALLENIDKLPWPMARVHPSMDDDALFGGMDIAATLASGRIVNRAGVLASQKTIVMAMAERCGAGLAARLACEMDQGRVGFLVCLDEGADEEENTPFALSERLAFRVELDMGLNDIGPLLDAEDIARAARMLPRVQASDSVVQRLAEAAVVLGVDGTRPVLFALAAARAHAALCDKHRIEDADVEAAVALCLAHRATRLPTPEAPEQEAPQPDQSEADAQDAETQGEVQQLDDQVLDAVLAALPHGLLDQFKPKGSVGAGSGAGAQHKSRKRGRPKPSRPGTLSGANHLDLIATLRSAAPWQKLRRAPRGRVVVAPSDFRIKQYEERSERVLIFAVDASGSAAIARLGEAKGAIELLLGEAYSRRDQVSLISFRGQEAETLLPPTKSLVQTKKRLAALPGGGGTPLAAGLNEALRQSIQARRQGLTPCVVMLTDGRANVALDGSADRTTASADAEAMADHIRAAGIDSIVLDLGRRPSRFLEDLTSKMDGIYMPLPRADAHKVSSAVNSALAD